MARKPSNSPPIRLDPKNVREHSDENKRLIRASLEELGAGRSILLDGSDTVIAGNGVYEQAQALGLKVKVVEASADELIAVKRADLRGKRAQRMALADNRTSETSTWNAVALAELAQATPELLNGLWSQEELARILTAGGPVDVVEDEVPEPPDHAVTRPGDLWLLGDHRLLCGDSAKAEDVDRLLAGAEIHLVNTDPPYNVKVEPRSNNAIAAGNSSFAETKGRLHHQSFDVARQGKKKATHQKLRAKDRPLANDFVSDQEFERLLHAWFGNLARVLLPGRAFYLWGGYANVGNYPPVLKATGLYFSQAIIWVKEHPVLTRKDFMGNHEWCFYGWREGAAHKFFGPPNASDVWSVKKVNPQSMVHLTEKPVELAVRAMQHSSRTGENILDLFGGSGSTLIAAEQTGRKAYLMELDPLYCDVIVERWQKFTGEKASRQPGSARKAAG